MKKEKMTLKQTEILHFAITYLSGYCQDQYDRFKIAKQKSPDIANAIKECAQPMFWKLKKLIELYEMEAGVEYGFDFDFSEISDYFKE